MSDVGNCEVCGEPVKDREETRGVDQWQVVRETIYRHRKTAECLVANKALRDTITALRADYEMRGTLMRQMEEYIEGFRRDLEAARVDAERYRWLRDAHWTQEIANAVHLRSNAKWDKLIDAAREKE